MNENSDDRKDESHLRGIEPYAFCSMVDAVRKAQGKKHPSEFQPGTLQRRVAEVELLRDTLRMLGIDPDEPISAG